MAKKKEIKTMIRKEGDFIPPDGGWGWMIVIAAGFSNLAALPTLQQFGLLFRDKFTRLGITSSETTTIINMNSALTSCVGLANGPVFKTFSYRQVSLTGAIVVFVALLCTTFSYNFATYLISFSILYGAGYGISSSANALALNTYWKKRRRLATGLSWTTTGLGPIIWPQIITVLFAYFGETGTILILSGFALHAIACALLLQPVEWHSKDDTHDEGKLLKPEIKEDLTNDKKKESGYFSQVSKLKNLSAFSSQYLYNEDDPITPGYEITDPGIPMMLRANDGYFSQSRQSRSRLSSREGSNRGSRLPSKKPSMTNLLENRSRKSSTLYLNESKKNSYANLGVLAQDRETFKPKRKKSITEIQIPESEIEDCPTLKAPQDLKAEEKAVVENIDPEKVKSILDEAEKQVADSKSIKKFKLDPQYGEKYNKDNHSNVSYKNLDDVEDKKYQKDNHSNQSYRTKQRRKSNNFNYESEVLKQASLKLEQYLKENEDKDQKLKLLISSDLDDDVFEENPGKKPGDDDDDEKEDKLTFCEKVAMFFDLDLLQDFTFINLMLGITLANFNELNFSILTPFILGDYGMTKQQVAFFMSLLAGVDICVRFCIPFVAGKIGWDNSSFFLFGVISMAMGRVVLAYCQTYSVVLLVAVIIGFGKGLRTVFMALVIPTHVPLQKLPGATGIQLLTAGVAYLALGPVVGWIKDNASTALTLHCLNIFTWLTALSWGLEKYITARRRTKSDEKLVKA
uniref:Major facilitator superfamily (MFS) profile domain-containing protein n=2 Tax=Pectinophora gossypiella TaxID=13191 RepID=A0A1E1WP46_PECGO